jgi:pilus assembly protein FimV
MDFDITSTHPGIKVEESVAPKLDMAAMDFDVTGVQAKPAIAQAAPAEPAPSLNLDDLVFETPAKSETVAAAPVAEVDQGMAFSIDIPEMKAEPAIQTSAPAPSVGLGEISLNLDDLAAPTAPVAADVKDERWQEVATKLDLAKAYQEMGDQAGAREILEEVVRDGDEKQRATAQELLQQLA